MIILSKSFKSVIPVDIYFNIGCKFRTNIHESVCRAGIQLANSTYPLGSELGMLGERGRRGRKKARERESLHLSVTEPIFHLTHARGWLWRWGRVPAVQDTTCLSKSIPATSGFCMTDNYRPISFCEEDSVTQQLACASQHECYE